MTPENYLRMKLAEKLLDRGSKQEGEVPQISTGREFCLKQSKKASDEPNSVDEAGVGSRSSLSKAIPEEPTQSSSHASAIMD